MGDYLGIIYGTLAGIFSGIFPGLHLNTIVPIVGEMGVGSAAFFGGLAGAHLLSEFIPSMLLAAPSEELALSVLPSQRLLQKGEATKGLLAGLAGAFLGVLAFFALMPAALVALPIVYEFLYPFMGWLLLGFNIYLILSERRKVMALVIFLASGVLGLVVLNSSYPDSAKLFSLLTGCFGVSTLAVGLWSCKKLPEQRVGKVVSDSVLPGGLVGVFSGFLVGTFPAVSCSQAVALLSPLLKSEEEFIAAVSSASVSSMLFSALTLTVLGRARNGLMVGVGHLDLFPLLTFVASFSLSLLPATLLVLVLSRMILKCLTLFYRRILILVLALLLLIAIYLGGWWGLLVLLTSASLGVIASLLGVRRTECMGMLILPTILLYFGFA